VSASTSAIESVLVENRVFPPSEATVKAARISGMEGYNALCAEAENDFEGFWARLAKSQCGLEQAIHHARSTRSNAPFYKWFDDGELERLCQLPGQAHRHADREQDRRDLRSR